MNSHGTEEGQDGSIYDMNDNADYTIYPNNSNSNSDNLNVFNPDEVWGYIYIQSTTTSFDYSNRGNHVVITTTYNGTTYKITIYYK